MSNTPAWRFRKNIPSDTSVGSALVADLLGEMQARKWPDSDIFHVQLAYEEAIVNAIRHGNRCDPDKTVDVEMHCDDDVVRVTIIDQGPGFNPESVPDPTDEDLLEAPGGRGLLLIRETMSEVTRNEAGNRITLVKNRSKS